MTNTNKIQNIMREFFKKLYLNKMKDLEEIDKFLNTFDLTILNQEDISHIKRSITNNEIEA
jgi:hypothetical protein